MATTRLGRWVRTTPVVAWLLLALTIFGPLILLAAVLDDVLVRGTCTVAIRFFGTTYLPCLGLRIAAWVLGVIGIFSVVVLSWWLLNEVIGLRRIFEAGAPRGSRWAEGPDSCDRLVRACPGRACLQRTLRQGEAL